MAGFSRDGGVSFRCRVFQSPSLEVAVMSGHSPTFPGASSAAEGQLRAGAGNRIMGLPGNLHCVKQHVAPRRLAESQPVSPSWDAMGS